MPTSRKSSSSSSNVVKRKSLEAATSADITSIARTLSRKNSKENGERKLSMDKSIAKSGKVHAEQSDTLDEWEQIEDDEPEESKTKSSTRSKSKHRYGNILLPTSAKEIYKMFTLRTTNQILRGVSPTTTGSLSPRFPSKKEKEKIMEKERKEKPKKDWMELIASEIYSAKVNIVPPPGEGDVTRVARDPRSGRWDKKRRYGPPHERLCKMVRKQVIRDICHKLKLESAAPRIDTGLGKKLPTRSELKQWKLRRASNMEHWKKRKRKRVTVSTKKKKLGAANKQCNCCGDYHFRRVCGGRGDKKVNLLVRQIFQKADVIKQHMGEAWDKLDDMESAYQGMLLKVARLQSNRVCLGSLTGKNYPGEDHPNNCPCTQQLQKEKEDRKRALERKLIEEEKRREQDARRQVDRQKRERLIDYKKKRFYSKMQPGMSPQKRVGVNFEDDDGIAGRDLSSDETLKDIPDEALIIEGYDVKGRRSKAMAGEDLTKLDEAKRPKGEMSALILDDLDRTAPKSGLLAQMDALKGTRFEEMDLIMMDGGMKSLKTKFTEEGGVIRESISVESIPELDQHLEEHFKSEEGSVREEKEDYAESEIELPIPRSPKSPTAASERSVEGPKSTTPFGDFLDIMEIF